MSKYVCFDTETTGLDPTIHNLLTVCFIILDEKLNEIDRLNLSIKQINYNINLKAMEINKIDLKKHHQDSIDVYSAQKILLNFLEKNKPKNLNLLTPIGHRINFDINFIQHSNLLPKSKYEEFISINPIDTKIIAQFLKLINHLSETQDTSLTNLCKYFKIKKDENLEHTAEYDTEMTIQLLKKYANYDEYKLQLKL